jgi:tetratricopeptide (TPR) repeat protein
LNPSYATGQQWLGMFYFADGRFAEAEAALEIARQLDPLSFFIGVTATWPLPYLGRDDEAISRVEQILEMHPDVTEIAKYLHEQRGETYLRKKRPDAAVVEFNQGANVEALGSDRAAGVTALQAAFARAGIRGYWEKFLALSMQQYRRDVARASRQTQPRYVSVVPMARLHARLGHAREALALLDTSVRDRDENVLWLKAESLRAESPWTSVRSDPRFNDLLRRLGLTPL